jgi:hypothetical protein
VTIWLRKTFEPGGLSFDPRTTFRAGEGLPSQLFEKFGAGGGTRTHDLWIESQELNLFGFKRFPMFQ